jgi:hypothetical protein
MDVGAYVEDVMRIHFPKVKKADIYGWNKKETGYNAGLYHDSYYENILKNMTGNEPVPVPDYKTKDVYKDFSN